MCSALLVAIACGGGGGGGGASSSPTPTLLKARFNPTDLYNALPGDRLLIYRLGETDVYFDGGDIGTISRRLTVSFELEQHYIMAVERLGIQFLSTIITPDQINDAIKLGVLDLGDLNAVTTFLVHEIEPNGRGKDVVRQNSAVQTSLERYFEDVEDFQSLVLFDLLDNKVVKNDNFFEYVANRANAMTAFSALLRHNIENGKTSIQEIQDMQDLHRAVLTGTAEVWASASGKIQSSLPDFSNFSEFSSEVGEIIRPKLFTKESTSYFILDDRDLYEIFFDQDDASELFIYDLAVETPQSVISGIITGPGAEGAVVYLQRPSASGVSWVTQETVSDENGEFIFEGVQDDDEYRLVAQKPGFVYRGKTLSKAGNLLSVALESFQVDDTTLELTGESILKVKDGGIDSPKLADDITIRGDFEVEGTTNIGGMDFPTNSDGVSGQFLGLDGQGNITFLNGANLSIPQVISGDWINTANPWAINEGGTGASTAADARANLGLEDMATQPSNSVSITGGSVDNTAIGQTTAAQAAFTDLSSSGTATLADADITDLTTTGQTTISSANIGGMDFPQKSSGSQGEVLLMDASGNIVFSPAVLSNIGQTYSQAQIDSGNFTGNIINSSITATTADLTTLTSSSVSLGGGNINNVTIGDTTPTSAAFTTLNTSGEATLTSANIGGMDFPLQSDGTPGQYLQRDSSGNIVFTTISNDGQTYTQVLINSGNFTGNIINSTITNSEASLTSLDVSGSTNLASLATTGTVVFDDDLLVKGDTTLGDELSDSLTITANVTGGTAGGNVWFAGNLISSTNLFSLGTAQNPWREIYADDLITTSDERLKKNVEPLEYGLDEVLQMKPVSYEWNNKPNKGRTIGLLAQEVETVVEEAVSVAPDDEGTRGVRYYNMVPVLIKAIQDQQNIIKSQNEAMRLQEQRLKALEERLLKLQP